MRTLYFAHAGLSVAGWLDTSPPPLDGAGRCPPFRVPDVFHDRAVGSTAEIVRDFQRARILPDDLRITPISLEWARAGVRRAEEARARAQRRRPVRPNPEVDGLFAREHVTPRGRKAP